MKEDDTDVPIPEDQVTADAFEYLDGHDFSFINRAAQQATWQAHMAGGVPCASLWVNHIDEYAFGELYYFFMSACVVSGCLLEVHPFNQDGVEAYKRSMFQAIGHL